MIDGKKKHEGLEQKDVRDFLAKQMKDVWGSGFIPVKYAEEQFQKAKHNLEMARNGHALKNIIENLGWDEHDVSDYEKYYPDTYFAFIGTEEEYRKYIEDAKKLMEGEEN